jgi:hypothetical protein
MASHMHQPGANGDEPDPAKSRGHDSITPGPEMSPAPGVEGSGESRERASPVHVGDGDGKRRSNNARKEVERARARRWSRRISLIASDPQKLGVLYGFAQKLINEAAQGGVAVEVEAEDLAHTAIRRALEGGLRRRKANAPPTTGSSPAEVESSSAEDSVGIALSILCTTIGNEFRNKARAVRRRREGVVKLPRPVPADPAETVELGVDLDQAIAPLPEGQREALIAVCVHDKQPAVYAAERGIEPQTARNQVNLGKKAMRDGLRDYRSGGGESDEDRRKCR